MNKIIIIIGLFLTLSQSAAAQIAQGGSYRIEQSLTASGGGTNRTGGTFALDSAIGEAVAGVTSSGTGYSVNGGFFSSAALAPTAALVSVAGRVLTPLGGGLRGARVALTDASGAAQTVTTGARGDFRFYNVAAGGTYFIAVASKRYQFAPQVAFVGEDRDDLIFAASAPTGGVPQP